MLGRVMTAIATRSSPRRSSPTWWSTAPVPDPQPPLKYSVQPAGIAWANPQRCDGTIVRSRAVLAAGTILTRGTPIYDLPNNTVIRASAETPLIIPAGAVVVPGSRAVQKGPGKELGISVYTPIIVKYRDEKTELSTALEDILR